MSSNRIVVGDCREYVEPGGYDLVFGDPPFNIGVEYDSHDDCLSAEEYASFTFQWMKAGLECVKPGGVFIAHGCVQLRPVYWRALLDLGVADDYEAEVIWYYRFGQCRESNWIDNHCPWVVIRRPGERNWNPDNVLVESDRKSKYNDKRIAKSKRGGMRVAGTVWGVPSDGPGWGRVTNGAQRRPLHKNQIPLNVMMRAVNGYTKPGDWVLDMFSGSGTLSEACLRLGRNSLALDVSEAYVKSGQQRLLECVDGLIDAEDIA